MGFAEVLTLIFVVMKLLGYITWSWWLVFSPMIIVYGLGLVIFLIAMLIVFLKGII